jgi:DNA-binding SARP family transcriptional activator
VAADDGRRLEPPRRMQRVLLAVLLFRANQPVSPATLVGQLWEGRAPDSAAANLRSYLSQLRRLLRRVGPDGSERLVAGRGGYLLRVEPGELDAAVFARLAGEAAAALAEGRAPEAVRRYQRALRLWRGPVLANLPLPPAVKADATGLTERRLAAWEDSIEARLLLGGHRELVPELAAVTGQFPLREGFWAQRMVALYRAGCQADALAAYQEVRGLLAAELGVEPCFQLRRLHQQILAADPALTAQPLTTRPRPPRAGGVPAQLPAAPAVFTGRGAELGRLTAAPPAGAPAPDVRVIDGMAGAGKTALAVHAARLMAPEFPDGQVFLDLRGHSPDREPVPPAEAVGAVLAAFGVPAEQLPAHLGDRAALLRATVAGRRVLLVLDDARDEAQVRPLLPGTPGCLVLVTSRSLLVGLDDVRAVPLDVLPPAAAVELLGAATAAGRAEPLPAHVTAELADLCGGLPLTILAAAARLGPRPGWAAAHLLARLRDPGRRLAELSAGPGGVAAALDLSCRDLTGEQRRLYRLLGRCAGPVVSVSTAAVLAGVAPAEARHLLDELVHRHLLCEAAPGAFRWHDLVRAHAATVPDVPPAAGLGLR